jgi:ribosomal protein L40E
MGEYGRRIAGQCPKCFALLPWGSEKCPACGEALLDVEDPSRRKDAERIRRNEIIRRSVLFVLALAGAVTAVLVLLLTRNNEYPY